MAIGRGSAVLDNLVVQCQKVFISGRWHFWETIRPPPPPPPNLLSGSTWWSLNRPPFSIAAFKKNLVAKPC